MGSILCTESAVMPHLALPEFVKKLSTYLNIFINIFIFFKVNHDKNNKLNL